MKNSTAPKIAPALCELLPWDTDFFGLRIARVNGHRLDSAGAEEIKSWCHDLSIDCVYFLANGDDFSSIHAAEQMGFRLTDLRTLLSLNLVSDKRTGAQPTHTYGEIRLAKKGDAEGLETLASGLFKQTRFYADPNFAAGDADRLYRTWIRKNCEGTADAVWMSESGGIPTGFVTCHLDPEKKVGTIGLVGTAPEERGTGTSYRLMNRALNWFSEQGMASVEVVTQGRNLGALKLYQRHGFLIKAVQLWFHFWPTPGLRRKK